MNNERTWCKCYGIDRRTRCERDATQEDGLCNICRCPHGGCDHHGDDETFRSDLWFKEPVMWMHWMLDAAEEAQQCVGRQIETKVREDELPERGV